MRVQKAIPRERARLCELVSVSVDGERERERERDEDWEDEPREGDDVLVRPRAAGEAVVGDEVLFTVAKVLAAKRLEAELGEARVRHNHDADRLRGPVVPRSRLHKGLGKRVASFLLPLRRRRRLADDRRALGRRPPAQRLHRRRRVRARRHHTVAEARAHGRRPLLVQPAAPSRGRLPQQRGGPRHKVKGDHREDEDDLRRERLDVAPALLDEARRFDQVDVELRQVEEREPSAQARRPRRPVDVDAGDDGQESHVAEEDVQDGVAL
mmetsp:Transcript_17581/g.60813  ORF Transcript_17581/g.60813 Transcript_17581/m.60813 type:complete len:268 (+) Transcript_17581:1569-2372(+)